MRWTASLTIVEFGGHLDVIEVAPDMRPACGLMNLAALIKMMNSGVTIDLQDTAACAQVLARVFALVDGPIGEPCCRRCIKTGRAIYVRLHWTAFRKTKGR